MCDEHAFLAHKLTLGECFITPIYANAGRLEVYNIDSIGCENQYLYNEQEGIIE